MCKLESPWRPCVSRLAFALLTLISMLTSATPSGWSQDGYPMPASVPAKPSIKSFVTSSTTVKAGRSVTLTAVFTNGKGILSPGKLVLASAKPLKLTPAATTTYTLRVTNSAGVAVTKTRHVTVTPMQPSITSFSASSAAIDEGQAVLLTAIFSSGAGVVTPGNNPLLSGKSISVSPRRTTTYTLTVTNSAGVKQTRQAAVQVNSAISSPPGLGVNIGWVTDWDPTQMFADAMKQARKFGSVATPYDESALVDAQGWPTQDAGVLVMANNPGAWSAGQYALAFTGRASVATLNDSNVTIGPVSYNSLTNISSATVTAGPKFQNIYLVFTQTMRTSSGPVGSGVSNVSLMRPAKTGLPHASGTLFTDRFLDRLKYFSAMRMMDYLHVNDSTEAVWGDRALPANASQQQVPPHTSQNISSQYVTGGSYEYAVQLANQTGKDLWLNIPHLAFGGTYQFTSDVWASNLALLLKYGSDSNGTPYTGLAGSNGAYPQPEAGPVNPPLNPGLHVYLEYSNEFWSGVGNQSSWIVKQADAAIAAGDPDIDWDHDQNTYDIVWRIHAKGLMLIANSFAEVYGT